MSKKAKNRTKSKAVSLSQPANRWDMGPVTASQMAGKVIENATWTDGAEHLRSAFEGTQRTAPAIKAVQVDSTPKPDQHVAILIDRISKYSDAMRRVPKESIKVVEAVAIDNRAIGHLKEYRGRKHAVGVILLQKGLDAVADHMMY